MNMYTSRFAPLLIDFIFGLIQLILALKILLELLGANPVTPFVSWVYEICRTLQYPFQGIFPSPVLRGGFLLDMSAIVSLLVYAFIGYLVSELVRYINFNATRYSEERRK